ncbi:MAG TPA: TlpA disulfide reductase family protein [Ilumatobacteraceae bacterium]|nr:TlpA disulfide reductase family protein [Ilumatobacteraceae bacterium]
MAWRPRLPVLVLCAAIALGLVGGWALSRVVIGDRDSGESDIDSVVLAEPGEYQQPSGGENRDVDGERLPEVVLTDPADFEIHTSSLVGQPLVVNLWYSTCIPCKRELGEFATVHRELGDRVRFVGINPFDSVEVMERFAGDRGVGYELLRDQEAAFVDAVGVVNFPVTLFVDADGTIVAQTGEIDGDELRARIEELF